MFGALTSLAGVGKNLANSKVSNLASDANAAIARHDAEEAAKRTIEMKKLQDRLNWEQMGPKMSANFSDKVLSELH